MNKRTWLLASLSAVALLTGCATSSSQPKNLADTIAQNESLSMASQLIHEANLVETLRGPGPFTVFVPSNDAFKALPADQLAELQGNKELLKSVLNYHVVPAQIRSATLPSAAQKTVQGGNVSLAKAGPVLTIENAIVTQADIQATNGIVYVIDTVLLPPKKR